MRRVFGYAGRTDAARMGFLRYGFGVGAVEHVTASLVAGRGVWREHYDVFGQRSSMVENRWRRFPKSMVSGRVSVIVFAGIGWRSVSPMLTVGVERW